jgi:O-antigen/teichoic acid export membrane protein
MEQLKHRIIWLLRSTEKYTKTDMVYLITSNFWMSGHTFITATLGFLLSITFANLLPKETYGQYQYILSLSSIVGFFCLTGMNNAITRAVARGHEGSLRTSVKTQLKWMVLPFCISLIWALKSFLDGDATVGGGLLVISIATPTLAAFNTYNAFLIGKRLFRLNFFYSIGVALFYYVSIFIGITFLKDALLLATINIVSNTIATIYFYWKTIRCYPPNNTEEPDTLEYGKKMSLMNVFGGIVGQLDNAFVFMFLGPAALAVYALASNLPDKIGGFAKNIGSVALPKLSTRNHSEIKSLLWRKIGLITLASSLVCLAYIFIAPTLFRLVFPKYLDAVIFTQVYSISLIFSASYITSAILFSQKLKKEMYLLNIGLPIFQTILQIILILLFGLWGMIFAKITSSALQLTISIFFILKRQNRS